MKGEMPDRSSIPTVRDVDLSGQKTLDLYVAHVAAWEPCNLHDLGLFLGGICTAQILHNSSLL